VGSFEKLISARISFFVFLSVSVVRRQAVLLLDLGRNGECFLDLLDFSERDCVVLRSHAGGFLMVEAKWWCEKAGQRLGPFNITQLKQLVTVGMIAQSDQLCQEGSTHWVSAETVAGLFSPPELSPSDAPAGEDVTGGAWFYAKSGHQLGPFTVTQLRQFAVAGILMPTDLIWKADGGKAQPAGTVIALFPETCKGDLSSGLSAADPVPSNPDDSSKRWIGEYAGVGVVGAVASSFSPDLQSATSIAALATGCMVMVSAWDLYPGLIGVGFALLAAIVGAAAGAITFSTSSFLAGVAMSAVVGGSAGLALGSAIAVTKGRIR